MNVHTYERAIHITDHAMQRLKERVGDHDGFKSWKQLVKKARYYGRISIDMDDTEIQWCREKTHALTSSAQIRIMNGFAFLFMGNNGHARTLVTVNTPKGHTPHTAAIFDKTPKVQRQPKPLNLFLFTNIFTASIWKILHKN